MSGILAKQTYQQNAVKTASPGSLTLMLYKGAVRFINAAIQDLQQGKYEDAHKHNVRAQDIVNELMITLNKDIPISKELLKMYDYIHYRLVQANVYKDVAMLEEAKGYMEEFVEVWEQVMKKAKA
ncbi:flagellar export chaperone FliS [Aneurinibacillus uraniidurans]|uniref:flagellar export chaperone FliS n=1 Tax=Aneurinibacillus uraniidurans TaxID=2966586 RepID=UPI00234B6585|nr:flagellar export chaperone FliS [Aneurinibacillus sp. B1]WCN38148.1 flagellar export chaperone FliS [Aneurinibacillus sp. B1]